MTTRTNSDAGDPDNDILAFLARAPVMDVRGRVVANSLLYRDASLGNEPGGVRLTVEAALFRVAARDVLRQRPLILRVVPDDLHDTVLNDLNREKIWLRLVKNRDWPEDLLPKLGSVLKRGHPVLLDYHQRDWFQLQFPEIAATTQLIVIAGPQDRAAAADYTASRNCRLMFSDVNKRADIEEAKDYKPDFISGTGFAKPQAFPCAFLPSVRQFMLPSIGMALESGELKQAHELIARDPGMALRVLYHAELASEEPHSIRSLRHALIMMSEQQRRWLLAFVAGGDSHAPVSSAARRNALIKARFCELMAEYAAAGDPEEAFLAGLMVNMDEITGEDAFQFFARINLVDRVKRAVLEGVGPMGDFLSLAGALRSRRFYHAEQTAKRRDWSFDKIRSMYEQAQQWADE